MKRAPEKGFGTKERIGYCPVQSVQKKRTKKLILPRSCKYNSGNSYISPKPKWMVAVK